LVVKKSDDGVVSGAYMIRKRFFVPKSEFVRDYRDGHELYPSNFLFDSDFLEVDDD